jgi:hypothetical protein
MSLLSSVTRDMLIVKSWIFKMIKYFHSKTQVVISRFKMDIAKPEWFLTLFLILSITVFIGGRTSASNGPFDQSNIFGLGTGPTFVMLIICWASSFLGYFFSQSLTYRKGFSIALLTAQVLLILFYTVYTFKSFPESELILSSLGIITVTMIGLMIGITGGNMAEPSWLGDILFTNQIKKEMVKQDISFIYCDKRGIFTHVPASEIKVYCKVHSDKISKKKSKIIFVGIDREPLTNYAPVIVTTMEDGGTSIYCGLNQFKNIYFKCNASWRSHMSPHYEALEKGVERISWILFLLITVPSSPLNIGFRTDLVEHLPRNIAVEKIGRVSIRWRSPSANFNVQFPNSGDIPSALGVVLGCGDAKMLEVESEIMSKLHAKNNNSNIYFLRSFSHLMIKLRTEYIQNVGSKSEVCRLTINAMAEWYILVIKSKPELFPQKSHPSFQQLSDNVVSLHLWEQIIFNTISQPPTMLMRLHDRAIDFIEKDIFVKDKRIKRIFDEVITDSIEQTLQTSSVDLEGESHEMKIGRRKNNHHRIAAMLIGVCQMELLISLYDDPSKGVV